MRIHNNSSNQINIDNSVSTCHTERREIRRDKQKVAIIAVLADGNGLWQIITIA
jgi:hypothetical protein